MGGNILHELLAVEGDLEGAHKRILEETKNTFVKKESHFLGMHRKLTMFVEDNIDHPETNKKMDTTVDKKLDYMSKTEIRYFDALLQKESTNQIAIADLIVDEQIIAKDLPATFCLGMETRLRHLRAVYEAIPTLAPGISWVSEPDAGPGVYKAEFADEKLKTETVVEPMVLYKATVEHPAQIKEVSKVNNVGKYVTTNTSGMLSPANKSDRLAKVDKLIRAFKQARQRANTTKVNKMFIGEKLFTFINS